MNFNTIPEMPSGTWKKQVKRYGILFFILSFLAGGAFFVFDRLGWISPDPGPMRAAPIQINDEYKNISSFEQKESEEENIPETRAEYQSERFRSGEIAIGGEAEFLAFTNDPDPLAISTVRGEAFTEKGKNTSKLVITWETNKPAKSEISYGKGIGQTEGALSEEAYGFTHSVVISELSQSTTYVYVIASRDQFGNEVMSEPYAVYTGAREISLFELIAGAIGDVFGWAVEK